jgi:hypothetical protein
MGELNQKLDKDTFNRFKLIQHLIKKYPIIQYDISRIEEIKKAYIEYNPKYTTVNGKIKFTDSEFLSKHVLNQLETFNKYIQIVEDNIDIKIAGHSVDIDDNKLINQIYSVVKLFHKLYGKKKIQLKIGLTDIEKKIDGDIITTEHVNGGLNYVGTGKIEIFRKEEIVKVLCHELAHDYKLDCDMIDNFDPQIVKKFKIKTTIVEQSINEGYTEFIGLIHHIAILNYYTNIHIWLLYHYEKIWSLYQVCKILTHYKMKRFEDIYTTEFKQGTNVFSYYIVKFFILYKYNNTCSYKSFVHVMDDPEVIKIINDNLNQGFDGGLRMTLFQLK